MDIKIFMLVVLSITLSVSKLTIQEYPEYELQTPQLIFHEIQQNREVMHPNIDKLVFITPWNNEGKLLTVKYAHKLKYISPCWYDLIVKDKQIQFENSQLVDKQYLRQIKTQNPDIKILPRVYLNSFEVLRQIGSNKKHLDKAVSIIIKMIEQHGFDGIVWDSPYDLFADQPNIHPISQIIADIVNSIKDSFAKVQSQQPLKLFFNMANPSGRDLSIKIYKSLKIDALLIQNYDGKEKLNVMAKNSIDWVKNNNLNFEELIMMMPFFSYKNGQGTSTKQVAQELNEDGIIYQGFAMGLCKFISEKKVTYLVPCHRYFEQIFTLIQEQNFSVGFWEGGNGLENYYKFL